MVLVSKTLSAPSLGVMDANLFNANVATPAPQASKIGTALSGGIASVLPVQWRTLDRRETPLYNLWIEQKMSPTAAKTSVLSRAEEFSFPIAKGPLFAMMSGPCPSVWNAIVQALRAGERAYVLCTTKETPTSQMLTGIEQGKLLVRRVSSLPTTALCSSNEAWLLFGAKPEQTHWNLRLDETQRQALRLAMLHLFWHHATDEAWNNDGVLVFRPCAQRPFEVALDEEAPIRLFSKAQSNYSLDGELVYDEAWNAMNKASQAAFFAPKADNHELAASLAARGVQVSWRDHSLPRCAVKDAFATLLLTSADWTLELCLYGQARDDLRAILQQAPAWRFASSTTLGALERSTVASVWLKKNEKAPLAPLERKDLGVISAPSLRASQTLQPEQWSDPQPLSLKIAWSWQVRTPSVPKGASRDPMLAEWDRFHKEVTEQLEEIGKRLEQQRTSMDDESSLWKRIKSVLSGFRRAHERFTEQLEELRKLSQQNLKGDEAASLSRRLCELEEQTAALCSTIEETKRQEKRAMDKQEMQRTLDTFEQQREETTQRIEKIKRELSTLDTETRSERDRKAKQQRLSDEQTKEEQKLAKIQSRIEEAKEALLSLSNPSQDTATTKGTNGFVPNAPAVAILVPREDRPSIGKLFRLNQQRFLAISHWEQLAEGEQEAKRLNAQLVAEQEGR